MLLYCCYHPILCNRCNDPSSGPELLAVNLTTPGPKRRPRRNRSGPRQRRVLNVVVVVESLGGQSRTTSNGTTDLILTMILVEGSGLLRNHQCLSGSLDPMCWGHVSVVVRMATSSQFVLHHQDYILCYSLW